MTDTCSTQSYIVNSGITNPNLTKFLHDVAAASPLLITWQYCNLLWNARAKSEGGQV